MKWLTGIICTALLYTLCGCSSSDPDMSQAKPYQVLMTKDVSYLDRTRKDFWIFAAEAKSSKDYAHTAMKAAVDLRNTHTIYVSRVFLIDDRDNAGKGSMLARAVWAPNGKGFSGSENEEWEVEVKDCNGYYSYNAAKR